MFSADLGVNPVASAPSSNDPPFQKVALLLHGDGTNGAQNNTFVDSSTNNFTITRTGNVAQGTFSPFSLAEGQWSNYFDGSGDYLSIGSQAALGFGTGDWTIETWVYAPSTSSGTSQRIWSFGDDRDGLEIISGNFQSYNGAVKTIGTANANTWVHVAGVRNSGTIYWYINGILATSYVDSTNSSARTLDIGTIGTFYSPKIQFYTGYISNLRIVKGTAVYTTNFTPPTAPLTAISGTSLLTCQSNRFIDNSSNNFTITRNGDTKVTAFSPFAPSAAYSASTNGGSAYFDGSGDYLTLPSGSDMSGTWTVEGWWYPTAGVSTQQTILSFSSSGAQQGINIWCNSSGRLVVDDGNTGQTAWTGGSFVANAWNHIAVVRNGTTTTGYINGISVGSHTFTPFTGITQLNVARFNYSLGYVCSGYITNVRSVVGTAIYTANFTPPTAPLTAVANTQLLLNCTNAGIIDNAGKNDIETVGNAQISTSVKKYGTGSMYFDGSGDWLDCNFAGKLQDFNTGDFTIEFWLNLAASPAGGYYDIVGTANNAAYLGSGLSGWVVSFYSSGKVTFYYQSNKAWVILADFSVSLATNNWYHIAYSRSGTSLKCFVDGVQKGSTVTNSTNIISTSNIVRVGGGYGSALNPLNGYIDDLRITKGQALYTSNFTPPTQAFPNV